MRGGQGNTRQFFRREPATGRGGGQDFRQGASFVIAQRGGVFVFQLQAEAVQRDAERRIAVADAAVRLAHAHLFAFTQRIGGNPSAMACHDTV